MSGNIKTLNSSNLENNVLFEEWHKGHNKKLAHCTSTNHHYKNIKNRFILLGTPNVGKSTFFNKITTANAVVSNIDRMTVEDTIGRFRNDKQGVLVDLPGIYNLSHPLDEEMVVAHEIYHEHYDKIVNIIGAQSLERDLLLTVQLLESGMLSTVVINMIDEVTDDSINPNKLSRCLNNVPIIFTQANRGVGINKAETSILHNAPIKSLSINYPQSVERLIAKLIPYIPARNINQRFFALMLLEGNDFIHAALKKNSKHKYVQINKILKRCNLSKTYDLIYQTRKNFIKNVIDKSANKLTLKTDKKKQRNVDRRLLNK
jgi:ferrous iron transport protein B